MSEQKKSWDLTTLHSLEGAAEWIRKRAGGLLVLVVRAEDVAFAVDPGIAPGAARQMVETVMPEVQQHLEQQRIAAREKAKKKEIWPR